jgi:hypothetical protein
MRPGRVRWLIAGVIAVVTAGICLGVWLNRAPIRALARAVDQAQVRAILPAITAYLQSAAYRDRNGESPPAAYQAQRVRWLCNAGIVEIRPEGTRWRVGMDVACGDYARRGNKVFMDDGGDMGHEFMILSGSHGRYQVLSAAQEPGVTPDPGWIDQNFSAPVAAEINSGEAPMAPWPTVKVLRAFGCQSGAIHGSVISVVRAFNTLGWPCGSA